MRRTRAVISAVVGLAMLASLAPASVALARGHGRHQARAVTRTAGCAASDSTTPTLRFTPRVINAKSRGRWVEAKLNLGLGVSAATIDTSTVAITDVNGIVTTLTPVKMRVSADTTTAPSFLCMKFSRKALVALLSNGKNAVTVSGTLKDGTPFAVTGSVRVKGVKRHGHGGHASVSSKARVSGRGGGHRGHGH
jgi:hypothetical protein